MCRTDHIQKSHEIPKFSTISFPRSNQFIKYREFLYRIAHSILRRLCHKYIYYSNLESKFSLLGIELGTHIQIVSPWSIGFDTFYAKGSCKINISRTNLQSCSLGVQNTPWSLLTLFELRLFAQILMLMV